MSNKNTIEKKKQTLVHDNNALSNMNSLTVIDHHMNAKTSNQLLSNDLLSTNSFLGSNDYFNNYDEEEAGHFNDSNNVNGQGKTATKETEKIIIINSLDRNHYYEKLNNFSIKFNPSSNKFIIVPVYENNPTVPQTYDERKKGVLGVLNVNGWSSEDGIIYEKYDASKPYGEIVAYDSILQKANHSAYVPYNIKNITSIKISKMLIPLGMKPSLIENNKPFTNYVKVILSDIDSYYHSTSSDIEMTTEIMVPEEHSLINSNWYTPLSDNTSINYDPPKNNINNVNFSWYPAEWNLESSIYKGDNGTHDGVYDSINTTNTNNILQELWLKDIVKIYGIEFDESFIILKTSFFSSGEGEANNTLWKYGSSIQLHNIIDNITLQNVKNRQDLSNVDDYLTSNNHMIIGTALVVNGEEKRSLLNVDDEEQYSQNLIKNRIIILANQNNKIPDVDQLLGDNYELATDIDEIGSESISLTETMRTLNITMKTFYDNKKNEHWRSLWLSGLVLNNSQSTWMGKGAYIINVSMQNLYALRVKYLQPYIMQMENNK